jgi:predicted PurR-regulated permease PerM
MNASRPAWSSQTKWVISLLLLGMMVFLIFKFSAVITPLVLAAVLAFVLSPLVNLLQIRLHLPRVISILFVYILLACFLSLILARGIPILVSQFSGLNEGLHLITVEIESLLGKQITFLGMIFDGEDLLSRFTGSIEVILEPVFGSTLGLVAGVLSSLVWVVFIFVISFYLIKDSKRLWDWFDSLLSPGYRDDIIRIRGEINTIWSAFFRGQLILAVVVALIITTVGLVIGLRYALVLGVMAGILEFIPSIGHGIWLGVASIVALIEGSTWIPVPNWAFVLLIISLHIVFQQFDLNYLIPRIIGRSVHLPPLVVILGIIAGASVAGVLGVVLAAPTIASFRVLGRYIHARLLDRDPFPEDVFGSLPPPNPFWWKRRIKRVKFPMELKGINDRNPSH